MIGIKYKLYQGKKVIEWSKVIPLEKGGVRIKHFIGSEKEVNDLRGWFGNVCANQESDYRQKLMSNENLRLETKSFLYD